MPSIQFSSAAMVSLAGRGGAVWACGSLGRGGCALGAAAAPVNFVLPRALRDAERRASQRGTVAVASGRCVGAGGKDGDLAVLLDMHGEFGADEIEALGAHMTAEQA